MRHVLAIVAVLATGLMADRALAEAKRWSPGDSVVVTASGAHLMIGNKSVAPLARGASLKVTEVRGNWLATSVELQGKRVDGWVWSSNVEREGARTYSFEPAAPATTPVDQYDERYITGLN